MHSHLLLFSLPPQLHEQSTRFLQPKRLMNQVVREISSLRHNSLMLRDAPRHGEGNVYEGDASLAIRPSEPRLRLASLPQSDTEEWLGGSNIHLLWVPEKGPWAITVYMNQLDLATTAESSSLDFYRISAPDPCIEPPREDNGTTHASEIIPLVSNDVFFQMLCTAIRNVAAHMHSLHADFVDAVRDLSQTISHLARPSSFVSSSFRPYSMLSNAGTARVSSHLSRSELYTWREIFQLYVEMEVFMPVYKAHRGERSVENSEDRLQSFIERLKQRGLEEKMKLGGKQSQDALKIFLELNTFILRVSRFEAAHEDAMHKILKTHPLPGQNEPETYNHFTSLARALVDVIEGMLLPIIPQLDDYTCLICTSIAFKPIRLACGHFFCVRCLVKLQKRRKGNCPMCRAPSVTTANQSNVDWALMNLMQDWFPDEVKEKQEANEKEVAREQMVELGFADPDRLQCVFM